MSRGDEHHGKGLLAGSGGFGRVPAWGSGCRPARVVTFRSPLLRDWSNVGNPGSVQDGFGVGRAVAGDPLGFRRGAGPAGSVPGFPAGRAFRVFGGGLRSGFLPGARHRGQDVAALGFLPVQGVPTRAVPRTRCPEHGVHLVEVVWARPESGFTLLFEALLIEFATAMPVARVAAMTREHDTRIWRVLEHHVAVQREKLSFADARRVLFATEGRDSATVAAFADDLTGHGGDPERISDTSSDMSQAFIAGIGEHLPNAKLTYDRYHVIAKLNEAVDQVRRAEQKDNPALKKTRYVWLKNRANLTVKQQDTLTRPSMHLATAR